MLSVLLAALLLVACSDSPAPAPPTPGHLIVYVYWDGIGVPDRTLEIVGTGEVQTTDENGLAEFDLDPGRYLLRAHVNGPGPPLPQDQEFEIRSGEDKRIEVADCLPCV